jgi:ABC-type lipoprotein release transport system permease subunit
MTFLIAILLLLTPVLVASLRPALQAASVDPVEALRAE